MARGRREWITAGLTQAHMGVSAGRGDLSPGPPQRTGAHRRAPRPPPATCVRPRTADRPLGADPDDGHPRPRRADAAGHSAPTATTGTDAPDAPTGPFLSDG